jgi:hypothetical protein
MICEAAAAIHELTGQVMHAPNASGVQRLKEAGHTSDIRLSADISIDNHHRRPAAEFGSHRIFLLLFMSLKVSHSFDPILRLERLYPDQPFSHDINISLKYNYRSITE